MRKTVLTAAEPGAEVGYQAALLNALAWAEAAMDAALSTEPCADEAPPQCRRRPCFGVVCDLMALLHDAISLRRDPTGTVAPAFADMDDARLWSLLDGGGSIRELFGREVSR